MFHIWWSLLESNVGFDSPTTSANIYYKTYAVAGESNPVTFPVGSYHWKQSETKVHKFT